VIRLLGRQTSGNAQKVIFCLEELGLPYVREDYGRQFNNTLTEAYRKLNPNAKVPTLIDGDLVIWESHTILRYLAAVHGPTLTGASAAERTMVERWMDWLLGALNTPYVAVFRDAKKAAGDRFTIADIALGSIVKRCLEFPIERPAYSELERWQAAIDARPAFAVAIGAKPSVLTPAA
jgi:glutathione S-transferase